MSDEKRFTYVVVFEDGDAGRYTVSPAPKDQRVFETAEAAWAWLDAENEAGRLDWVHARVEVRRPT